MSTVVVPFRGTDPKRRLDPLPEPARRRLASAMLADVLAAAAAVGDVVVVALEEPDSDVPALYVRDPKRGQGAAVRDALDASVAAGLAPPYLVVNADLPCVTPRDLLALAGSVPADGIAVAAAGDGTTNALGLARADLFEPVYGPGSAARFEALAPSLRVDAPNLVDDVDVPGDLRRLRDRLGRHTHAVLAALRLGAAA